MATAPRDKTRVFMSYARADGEQFATDLRARLEKEHPEITLWQDRVKMEGGRDWWLQITEAIQNVEFMVLVMTPAAIESKTVQREWRHARSQGVCVYPVRAVPNLDFSRLPKWMSSVHWYDLDKEWSKFINDLNTRCEVAKVPFMAEEMPSDFVERSAEYDALKSALLEPEHGDPVAITAALRGAGGFGKTTLAKVLCHDDDLQTAFDDGILWVTLGENPNVLEGLNILINALSPEHLSIANFEEAILKLGELLADRDCLIVIDDVWDSNHLRPFLRNGPRCARLITTRFDYTLPEKTIAQAVDSMKSNEALELLSQELPEGQTVPLRTLAERLGEWPLMLKLINRAIRKQLKRHRTLSDAIGDINEGLDDEGFEAIHDLGMEEERFRTALSCMEVTFKLLEEDDYKRYERLAIFPEDTPIPLHTLEQWWGLKRRSVERLCDHLAEMSLLLDFDLNARTIRLHDVFRKLIRFKVATRLEKWHDEFLVHWRTESGKWADIPSDEPYLWNWLGYHLVESGHSNELIQTVKDLRYLAYKTYCCGSSATETDILNAEKFAPSDQILAALRKHFVNTGHFLKHLRTRMGIVLTLYNRLQHVEELTENCRALALYLPSRYILPWRDLPDLPHPALVRTLSGHSHWVNDCVISSDGSLIFSASEDGTLRIWDSISGHQIRSITVDSAAVNGCAISPDNSFVASASDDSFVRIWEVSTGRELQPLRGHSRSARGCVISPDGSFIVSASNDSTLKVWDTASGQEIRSLIGHTGKIRRCSISPDGSFIVSGSDDRTLKVWDTASGQEIRSLIGHADRIWACAISPDGSFIVSGSNDGTLKIWDTTSGQERHSLIGHSRPVLGCAISPDGSFIVSASDDGTLKIWDTVSARVSPLFIDHTDWVHRCSISPDGSFIVADSDDRTLKIWDTASGQEIRSLIGHTARAWACAISPDGSFIVSGSNDGTLKIWDTTSGQERHSLIGHSRPVLGCAISPDGSFIVSASEDRMLKIWDTTSGRKLRSLIGHSKAVRGCAISPDGSFIVSASDDGTLKVWDTASGRERHSLIGHQGSALCCIISADGSFIVSGSNDRTLKVWDTASGRERHSLIGHSRPVLDCAISPDGQYLVSVSFDQRICVWRNDIDSFILELAMDGGLMTVAWHPDGEHLIAGGEKGLYWLRFIR